MNYKQAGKGAEAGAGRLAPSFVPSCPDASLDYPRETDQQCFVSSKEWSCGPRRIRSLVDYRNAVLQAQGDIENSIVAYLKSHQQLAAYRNAADASKRAVNIAIIRYQEGEEDFNTLINTLAANVQQDDLLAATRGSVATNLVQVYRALGGGWEIRGQQDPVDLLPAATKDEMRERTWLWRDALE